MEKLKTFNASISNGNIKYPIVKSIFAVNLPLKLSSTTVANSDIGNLKSFHALFDEYMERMLVKFERNCMVQTTRNLSFLTKNQEF